MINRASPGLARWPEKRKVGGSTPPLTTRLQHLHSLLTCGNASQQPVARALVSVVLYPLVTVIGRPLVHAECMLPQLARVPCRCCDLRRLALMCLELGAVHRVQFSWARTG
jgi:hypothetical protein